MSNQYIPGFIDWTISNLEDNSEWLWVHLVIFIVIWCLIRGLAKSLLEVCMNQVLLNDRAEKKLPTGINIYRLSLSLSLSLSFSHAISGSWYLSAVGHMYVCMYIYVHVYMGIWVYRSASVQRGLR